MGDRLPFIGPRVWHHSAPVLILMVGPVAFVTTTIVLSNEDGFGWQQKAIWIATWDLPTWFLVVRPRLILATEQVIVVRWLRTQMFPLRLVVRASPGYYGTDFELSDGRRFTSGTLQRPNYAGWLGRSSRSDRVAHHVLVEAARLRGEPAPLPPGAHKRSLT